MSETDSAILPETVVPALTQAIGQIIRRLRAEANPDGLSIAQTSVLTQLAQTPGMTNADLARTQAMKPQSMAPIIASLEKDGMIERHPHPTDGRQILFSLTPHGEEARRKRSAAKHEWLFTAIAGLGEPDRLTLLSAATLLRQIGEA